MILADIPTDVRIALPPAPEAAVRARRALTGAGLSEDLGHTVMLLVTEVVTNAVRHARLHPRQRIILLAHLNADYARVEVHDGGRGFDPEIRHRVGGLGLRLVDKLATRWGTERHAGCAVWFEVDRRPMRFGLRPPT